VQVTDFWGCEQSADYTLFEPTRIQLDVDSVRILNGWNITCFGDNDGFIEISSSGGILGHEYLWGAGTMPLPDPTQQNLYDLVADTFHLTITDSIGCTLDTVFEIRQPNELGLQETIPRINDWEIACAGDSTGEIILTPLGGADSLNNVYLWSTTDGYISDPASQNQANLPEGNYEVLVTDINGCTYQTVFELLDPDPLLIESLTADSAFCAGTATGRIDIGVSGGVDPYGYLWGGPDGYSSTDPDSIVDLYAGVYTITLTDDNFCVKDSLIEVFEADRFDVSMSVESDYHGADISCDGYSDGVLSIAPIGGTAPYFYAWNTGATTPTVTGLPEGTYSVVVNDKHGCIDSARVTITDPDPIDFTMYTEDPACYGDSTGRLEFLVTGGTVYTVDDYRVWVNDMVNGTVVENLPAGVYQIRVMDLNDCEADTEAELLDNPPIEISMETENAFCPHKPDGQLDLYVAGGVSPYQVSWSEDLPDNEYYFNELYSGQYVVSITDFNECIMTDTAVVGFTHESCLVIPNAFSPNGDGFNDLWVIEGLELYPDPEIRVFDRWGSRVYYSPDPVSDPWDGTFNGRRLPIDSYHYVIDLDNDEKPVIGNITIVR
jgi:gliding motility-associated-like protein